MQWLSGTMSGQCQLTKVGDLVASILETRTLRSGLASKLYGMLNFLELGMFGRVGAGGLQAIKERLQRGETITPELMSSLEVVQAVLATRPQRQFQLWWRSEGRMLAASDAAEDKPGRGSGGFHSSSLVLRRSGSVS